MNEIQQNQTAEPLLFFVTSSTDHVSPYTGAAGTLTVKLSKNGATGVTPSGAVSAVDATNHPGWFKIAGNATDANALGRLVITATATGADQADATYQVVSYNPRDAVRLGLTALPNIAATINGIAANMIALNSSQNAAACAMAKHDGLQGTYGGANATNNWDLGSLLADNLLGRLIVFRNSGGTVKGAGIINSQTNAATTTVSVHVAIGANAVSGDNWFILPDYSPQVDSTNARGYAQVKGIDANVITAASINAAALNGKGDWTVGNVTVGGFAANAITAAAIAAAAFNGKGDWVLASSYAAPDNAGIGVAAAAATSAASSAGTAAAQATTAATQATGANVAAAAVKVVTDHLATALETADAGVHYRYTTAALVNAPAGGGGGGGGFVGANAVTIEFRDAGGTLVPGVAFTVVGVGSAQAGTGSIAVGLDNGSYTLRAAPVAGVMWADKAFTVAGAGVVTDTGTAVSLPAASPPGYATGYVDLFDTAGAAQPGGQVEIARVDTDVATGQSFARESFLADADAAGRVTVSLQASTDFRARRGSGPWVNFTSPANGVFTLPGLLGQP